MNRIRVLIADDHALFRAGVRSLLDSAPDIEVVAEAGEGSEALLQAATHRPDVVLMDVSMPLVGGIAATKAIRQADPNVKVLAVSARKDSAYIQAMLDADASGYVFKQSAACELLDAIRGVAEGQVYLDSSLDRGAGRSAEGEAAGPSLSALSSRERTVLKFLAQGYICKQIAAELNVSTKTVETYRKRIAEKLGMKSRVDLVRFAVDQGWLSEEV